MAVQAARYEKFTIYINNNIHTLHNIHIWGGSVSGPPPEIHHRLLGLTDVQRKVVVVVECMYSLYLWNILYIKYIYI